MKNKANMDFIRAVNNTVRYPSQSIASGLVATFMTYATTVNVSNGYTAAAYGTGLFALACIANIARLSQDTPTALKAESVPTSVLATLATTAPIAIGVDLLTTPEIQEGNVMGVAAMTALTVLATAELKNKIWPKQQEQAPNDRSPV